MQTFLQRANVSVKRFLQNLTQSFLTFCKSPSLLSALPVTSMANVKDKLYSRANDKADKLVQRVKIRSEGRRAVYYICIVEGAVIDDLSKTGVTGLDENIARNFSNDF
jgi:hypothetical protein